VRCGGCCEGKGWEQGAIKNKIAPTKIQNGLKPKDLCMIPARVAIALQADGWYLRSEIVWHKPNPMPESVTDRPTKAHEMVYLLTKSPKYYYDAEAIKEDSVDDESYLGRREVRQLWHCMILKILKMQVRFRMMVN
jgi:DNA modification methylase